MTAIAAFELPIKITVNVISDGLEKSGSSHRVTSIGWQL